VERMLPRQARRADRNVVMIYLFQDNNLKR
jgi:hypothetical protein